MSSTRSARAGFNSLRLLMANVLLWIGILLLLIIVLKLAFGSPTHRRELDHSELMRQIDAKNIQEAKFIRSKNNVEIRATIRNPHEDVKATLTEREIGDLTLLLQANGVAPSFAEEIPRESLGFYGFFLFLILFFAGFFFLVRFEIRRLKRRAVEFELKDVG